jgi:predicted anti-sigma-YlaC factor YlaD
MSCTDVLPLISRLLDGEVSSSEQAAIDDHLACCTSCRQTREDWQQQGTVLRGFFAKAALDESFVQKVRRAAVVAAPAPAPKPRPVIRISMFRWAQAIAAVIVLAVVVVQFFPTADRHSMGKVLNAGDGLEVSADAHGWSAIAAGGLIKAGDWVRNPESSRAQIMLLNSFRLTLHQGALVQVGEKAKDSRTGKLTLLRGTVSSEAEGSDDLQLQTAAGSVSVRKANFDLHLDEVALPNLVMSDGNEVLSAAVLPVGGVRIGSGNLKVEAAGGAREIVAGNSAYFTPSQLSVVPDGSSAAPNIVASLQPDRSGLTRGGLMHSSIVSTNAGLLMQVRADGVPLKRLLETTTGETVSGAGDIRVTGSLAYPVQSSDESIVSAIGNQLGLTISVAQQSVMAKTAYLGQGKPRLVSELDPRPEYSVTRSPAGAVSFDFKSVAASRVFHALRSENIELPRIAEDDGWVPLTVRASEMEPGQVGAFLEKELGLVVHEASSEVRVVQVGGPAPSVREQAAVTVSNAPAAGGEGPTAVPFQAADGSRPASTAAAAGASSPGGWWSMSRAPVAVTPVDNAWVPAGTTTSTSGRGGNSGSSSTSATVTGKFTSRDSHPVQNGARHLTWPLIASADASVSYALSNDLGRRIGTVWHGYDASGALIAVQELVLEPKSSLSAVPGISLVTLGIGGHWETYSDSLLFYAEDAGSAPPAVAAIECDNLPGSWEFETGPIGLDGAVWYANPLDEPVAVVLAVTVGDRVVNAQRIVMAPHSGAAWTVQEFLLSHPEFASQVAGGAILLQASDGVIAADVSWSPSNSSNRGKGGEWVY